MVNPETTLGVRNNNPGNIERNNIRWQGMAPVQQGRFVKFTSPEWGIRAMARVLITYQDKHKCDTVAKIINRWAPPVENATSSYVKAVTLGVYNGGKPASDVQVTRWSNSPIDVYNYTTIRDMIVAMIKVECAGKVYDPDVVDEGLKLAGIVPARNQAEPSKRGRLLTIATAGTTVTAAGDLLVEASTHVETIRPLMSMWEYARWLVVALTIAGVVGALIRHLMKKRQIAGDAAGLAAQLPGPQQFVPLAPPAGDVEPATGAVSRA